MAAGAVYVHKGRITDIENEPGRTEIKSQFVELRAKGYSYSTIAKRLKVSKGTLTSWSRELESEIAALRGLELEALQEEFYVLKEGRIRLLGEQVLALRKELGQRDFSTVPTDKLLDLLLKYEAGLKEEFVDVRPFAAQDTATDTKVNSQGMLAKFEAVLQQYQTGQIDAAQARAGIALLVAMLKAYEQTVLEEKLDRIAAVLEARR